MSRSPRKGPAGCLIPFGLLFFLAGLAVCWFAWTTILTKVMSVRSWTETPCRVTAWETVVEPDAGAIFRAGAEIAYQYEAAGQTWTGTTYDAAMGSLPQVNELEEQGVAARAGPAVCYVNPQDPGASSYIRPGFEAGGLVLVLGLVFTLVGGGVVIGGILGLWRKVAGTSPGAGPGRRGCAGTVLAPCFFGLFAVAGFAVWKVALHRQPDFQTISARMVEVPAKIIASGVQTRQSSGRNNSTTYQAKVAFSYETSGRTWHSGWLDFDRGTLSSGNYNKARDDAGRYPSGSTARAWVDPQAPWQAVLEKDATPRRWLWLFPIIFGGIGVLGLLGWFLKVTALGAALFGTKRSADL